ncbi:hypothetical protein niasHS_008767 [Heterodera schachtii]|uniref:Uncharacterized protein n=1 Tax=Heterodera schachtii TaxID=97005 RepID=A0ABD2J9Y0_HETSC
MSELLRISIAPMMVRLKMYIETAQENLGKELTDQSVRADLLAVIKKRRSRPFHRFFTKCIDRLKGTDKLLPQVLLMQKLCKRGFAIHHSGILPIVKSLVELFFQWATSKFCSPPKHLQLAWK